MLTVTVESCGDRIVIHFAGRIDHASAEKFTGAFEKLRGTVCLNLRKVTYISSYGVGLLIRKLSAISSEHKVEFAECSETMVDQFQMLQFSRYGKITSFQARHVCARCNRMELVLLTQRDLQIDREKSAVRSPAFPCVCGGQLAVDDSLEFMLDHV